MVFFGTILASLDPKCSIIGYLRCHLDFSDLFWYLLWNCLLAPFCPFQIQNQASWVIKHVWFWHLWSVMLPGFVWLFWAAFWHHEIWKQASSELEVLWFRHIWSLIMPDYVKIFRHNFGIMRFKKDIFKYLVFVSLDFHDAYFLVSWCQNDA